MLRANTIILKVYYLLYILSIHRIKVQLDILVNISNLTIQLTTTVLLTKSIKDNSQQKRSYLKLLIQYLNKLITMLVNNNFNKTY